MSKQRIWAGVGTKLTSSFGAQLVVVMLILLASSWVAAADEPSSVYIKALCDQSVRNFRLLTPRETADDIELTDSDRHCACNMVHEAPWGAPKIEVDCSALELQNVHIPAKNLPFGAQRVDVSWNELTKVPVFAMNVNQLKVFKLNNNHIEKIAKEDFTELSYLEELDLSNNAIVEIEEMAFNDLTALKRLNLGYNNLKTMPEYVFRKMTNLVHLTLNGNDLNELLVQKNLFFNFEVNAESLQVLELEYCQLTWLSVESAVALKELRVRGNSFFKQLPLLSPGIKLLDLSANPVRRLDNTFYNGQLNELEILLLEDMPNLYILDVSSMATFHKLRKLSLQGSRNFTYLNELTFDCVESAYQEDDSHTFEALNEIILTGTKVRKLSEEMHPYMPNVEIIALDGCPMVCDCDLKWLMGKDVGITTNGICAKPLSMNNKRIDDVTPESIKNCSDFSRVMFKIMNGLLILLMIILCCIGLYFLVIGCRPSKKFYIRQRLGVNSPYSRITVEPLGQSYRPTTIPQA